MRLLLAALLSPMVTADTPRILIADVALSEFAPPIRLTLDLDPGGYDSAIPADWPDAHPKPPPRHDTLGGTRLDDIRAAYAAAITFGLGKPGCDGSAIRAQDMIITNVPVPVLSILSGGRRLTAPADWTCFTKQAIALQARVDGPWRVY